MGAVVQHDACAVHDPVAGDHLRARLATRMDRDHHHLRADFPADAEALQHRPNPVGHAGVCELAGGVPVAAGRDVGVLPQGRRTEACHAQPDLRRHDALHADCYPVHGNHVSLAGNDALAAELPLRQLTASATATPEDPWCPGADPWCPGTQPPPFNVIAPIEQHHDWYGRIRPKPNSVDMSADIRLLLEGPCPVEKEKK